MSGRLCLGIVTALLALTDSAAELSLNGHWQFKLLNQESDDSATVAWSEIDVPSSWELQGYGTPIYGEGAEARIDGSSGLYRRTFVLPSDWSGRIFLRFDGVQFGARVHINGRTAADFTSSFNAHTFDITERVAFGEENTIDVQTHGYPKGAEFDTNDDWTLHGIFRDVTLIQRPDLHLKDWTLTTHLNGSVAEVSLKAELSGAGSVGYTLLADDGRKVAEGEGLSTVLFVTNAALWTAETPSLYTLEMRVRDGFGRATETLTERVGLKEVTWGGRVFRVNGRPVKLRGLDHHDLTPYNGRAVTPFEQWRDAKMIKQANCNFVRTSHYPPSRAFLDACDELGLYVADEVPFGLGDKLLSDASYGDILLERARLTLARDKNRACVALWNVGNENPVTDITRAAARLVQRLDPSRPWTFPMQPHELLRNLRTHPPADVGDLVNWHYPLVCGPFEQLYEKYLNTFDRPYLSGEYAHAYGLDFGLLETYFDQMWKDPAYAGGAVWLFQDQGILRKAADIPLAFQEGQTWPDAQHLWDTKGLGGTDGVVYADRTPQTCYYELRKVYAPVAVEEAHVPFAPGQKQTWWVALENRFDTRDLAEAATGRWQVFADRRVVAEGPLELPAVAPHGRAFALFDVTLPTHVTASVWRVEFVFRDKSTGDALCERSYPLRLSLDAIASCEGKDPSVTYDAVRKEVVFKSPEGETILSTPILARVDRRPMIAETFCMKRHDAWTPNALRPKRVVVKENAAKRLVLDLTWAPENAAPTTMPKTVSRELNGTVAFAVRAGRVHVDYALAYACDHMIVETGIAFALPEAFRRFDWVGQGPYEAYPWCARLDEFGVWAKDRRDLYFVGNRPGTHLVAVSAEDGRGLVLRAEGGADVAFEYLGEGALLGHTAFVAGKGCKFKQPLGLREARCGEKLTGSFDLQTVAGERNAAWVSLFGAPRPLRPFMPFYKTYDLR